MNNILETKLTETQMIVTVKYTTNEVALQQAVEWRKMYTTACQVEVKGTSVIVIQPNPYLPM